MNKFTYIDIHSHTVNKNDDVFALINCIVDVDNNNHSFHSAGIHPWYINEKNLDSQFNSLKIFAKEKNCLAIGECGLDKLKGPNQLIQERVFQEQLFLATELNKPLIIHNVKKIHRIHELILNYHFKGKLIFHGVNSNPEFMHKLNESNQAFFSFGRALFNENSNASILLKELPLNKLFLETDDSEYTIIEIYNQAIKLLNIDKKDFIFQMQQNFKFVFNYGID